MQTITLGKVEQLDFKSAEAFKALRTNIQFSGTDVKVISVTSCLPNEGKSSVTMNLALSLAEAGKKVLFIDADMRKSVLAGRHKIKNVNRGLSHYLSGQCKFEEVICVTNIESFYMVTAGPVPPNPSEILGGKNFERLISETRKIYDYVIIDSPPIGSVIDGAIIGRVCDGVVLLIAADSISYKFAQKVKRQLEMAGCKILGVVLNKVTSNSQGYYGKYYGKYYGDYYSN
ncbi:MAG: polysaccharide biosynthesis tyrosine autokinase [Lachnospiraceae bacterium]